MKYLPVSKTNLKKAATIGVLSLALSLPLTGIPLAAPQNVQAQETLRTFTVSPPSVAHTVQPGEKLEGTMKIFNDTSETLTFTTSILDFIVDNDEGRPTILQEENLNNKYSAASWIAVYPGNITVKSKERAEVTYYIQVPEDAKPGGRYAAVIYKPDASLAVDGTGTAVQTQIGTLFYITVAGPVTEKAEVSKFDGNRFQESGPFKVVTSIKNLSDLHIRPKGFIKVSNMFGRQSYTIPLTEHNIFPEVARNYENEFGKKFMLGRYKAELVANYGVNNNLPLTASYHFWVFPWRLAVVIILVIVAAILAYLYMKKKGKKDQEPAAKPQAAEAQQPVDPNQQQEPQKQ